MRNATALVGNSSSGIHEAATFNVPVVNVGSRQQGRLRPENVIDVGHNSNDILKALQKCKKMKADGIEFENPYGDGDSAAKIVALLKTIDLSDKIIQKDYILMKKVFITGGSGTVGEAFISQFYGQYQFVSFSRNEKMQVALKRNFPDVEIILGAVEDKPYLLNSILNEKPDIVIHAAALKHVDSAEKSPIAAVKSNIIGSLNVIESCIEAGVKSSIAISTDKACAPDSNYGQTKALMEQMFLEAHNERCKFNVCRFGNVSHSHGSVIPYWLRLKESGQPLPLTHKDMNRLVISRADLARLVHDAVLKSENDDQPFILTKKNEIGEYVQVGAITII